MNREQMIETVAGVLYGEAECVDPDERADIPRAVIDAIFPQVTTVEDWAALPGETNVVGRDNSLWEKMIGGAGGLTGAFCVHGADGWERPAEDMIAEFAPLTVVWQP